jgi:hypothetical protein
MFAVACGAVPFSRWATRRRLAYAGTAFVAVLVALLPVGLPVLPLRTAVAWHIVDARADYKDEVGWPSFAAQVAQIAPAPDVIVARNYGEAGALQLFGHGLPPVASPHLTFRYWRPPVTGRNALLVGFPPAEISSLCTHLRPVGAISMPLDNDERGRPLLRCTLRGSLARLWPAFVRRFGK